jgi:hypothetical protein
VEPWALWCLVYGSVGLILAPFAALEGKWSSFAQGFLIPLAWIVAGLRLAKPHSWWSKQFYDRLRFQEAKDRYSWR